MKRIISLLLTLLLLAALTGAALAEDLSQTFTTPYFTLSIPGDWVIKSEGLDKEEDFEEFGTMISPQDPGLVIEAGMVHYSDLSDIALWSADEDAMQDYIDALLEDFEDANGEYVETLRSGSIPFVVLRASDGDGAYRYVDTMTNGYAIVFYVYHASSDDDTISEPTEAEWALFERILATFRPVA